MMASTLDKLRAAGWNPERRINVTGLAARLQARGFWLHPAAAAFLERFGLLSVRGSAPHWRSFYPYFHTDTDDVAVDLSWLPDVELACGTRVCPIGATAFSEYVLLMDQHGRVFGLDMYLQLTHWGDSGDELLDLVMSFEGVPRPLDADDWRPLDSPP